MSERIKATNYHDKWVNRWFWRTARQQEIDYIEEEDGVIQAFEFKWSASAKVKFPKTFLDAYPHVTTSVVNQENYDEFLLL